MSSTRANQCHPSAHPHVVGSAGPVARAGELARSSTVSIDGEWTVVVHGLPVVAWIGADWQATLVFGAGVVVSLLLLVLARSRERALRMVAQKTGELRYQASHDALTGLANRRALIAALSAQPAKAGADGELMLALFDLDGFKEYNDIQPAMRCWPASAIALPARLRRSGPHIAWAGMNSACSPPGTSAMV
jgi:Diguanylate cyclase, GGDEF domain